MPEGRPTIGYGPGATVAVTLLLVLAVLKPSAADPIPLTDTAKVRYQEVLRLDLPDRPALGDGPVYLQFSARIETGRYETGSAAALRVLVNDLPTSIERLVNKPPYYMFQSEQRVRWYAPAETAWVISYYPWDNTTKDEGFVHHYALDITNLLKPAGNSVGFESIYGYVPDAAVDLRGIRVLTTADFSRHPGLGAPEPVTQSHALDEFRLRALGYHTGVQAKLETQDAYRPRVGTVAPHESFAQEYVVQMDATGRIRISIGGDTYTATSWFVSPETGRLGIGQAPGKQGWDTLSVDNLRLACGTQQFTLERTLIRHPSHVEVRDHLTNLTHADLPLAFVNAVDVGDVAGVREFRISGQLMNKFWANTSALEGRLTGATPVIYVAREDSALGLVMEDDAYRNQGSVMVWDSTLALGDDMFYLTPRAEYTLVWHIFPIREPNYFTLVNALRHTWNLFQEIPGLFGFVHPSTKERMYEDVRCEDFDQVAEWVKDTGIDVSSAGAVWPFGEQQTPGILYGNEEMEFIREGIGDYLNWRSEVHKRGVDVPCLPYMNIHLCRLVDGKTLDDLNARLPACLIHDAYGTPVAYRSGWLYCVLPTVENASGKHLNDVMRFYIDECGFEGIYLDEWDHSRARVSFSHDDGVSALLDADGRIVRKVAMVPIAVRPFHETFCQQLVDRDAIIFANQFDDTLAAAQLPIVHFAEPAGTYDSYLISAAQCSRSPLSLNLKDTRGIWTDAKEFLRRGVLLCYYWKYFHGDHLLKRCYPIAVRELWPGVVIGEDRIITCASGTFTLNRDRPLTAYIYAGPDAQLHTTVPANATVNDHSAVKLDLTDDQIAVVMEE